MKGLLIKDYKLIKMQKRFFIVLIAVSLLMAFMGNDATFIMGYLTIVIPLFTLSTISYDEFESGNAFLFTLPISRKTYVLEKYFFGVLLGAVALLIGTVLALCMVILKSKALPTEIFMAAPTVFAAMLVILSIMLPLQLKFGAEKSRIAMIAIFGVVFAIGFGVFKLLPNASAHILNFIDSIGQMNIALLIADIVLAVLVILVASVCISIKIMNKKEF